MLKATQFTTSTLFSIETEEGRAWRYSVKLFLYQRLALSLAGLLAAIFFRLDSTAHISLLPSQVFAPANGWQYFVTSPWQRWDTEEYLAIASGGYSIHPALSNFPPLYPVLIGFLGRILFNHFLVAALLISNFAFLGALYFLYRLSTLSWGERAARYTCLSLVCFPTAHFFLMAYSESLFLLLTLASFYCLAKNRWWLACLLAGFAALTRLQGIVLLLPLTYVYWQQHTTNLMNSSDSFRGHNSLEEKNSITDKVLLFLETFKRLKLDFKIIGLLFVPFCLGLFELYTRFAISSADELGGLSKFWGIEVTWPGDTVITAVAKIFAPDKVFVPLYNIWGLLLLVLIGYVLWRGRRSLPVSYQLYAWASILLYLSRKGDTITTVSLERYLILIFPAFVYIGLSLSRKRGFYRKRLLVFSIGFMLQWTLALAFTFWFWTG